MREKLLLCSKVRSQCGVFYFAVEKRKNGNVIQPEQVGNNLHHGNCL